MSILLAGRAGSTAEEASAVRIRWAVYLVLLGLFCIGAVQAEEEESTALTPHRIDRPVVVHSRDVEDDEQRIELGVEMSRKRDGLPTKIRLPFLYRLDTGPNTELRVQSDFLTYQNPALGLGDLLLGVKWQFVDSNPSLGLIVDLELPTGSAGFGDNAYEPQVTLAFDYAFGDWEVTLNAGVASLVDGTSLVRYGQSSYGAQLLYTIDPRHSILFGVSGDGPDQFPEGIAVVEGTLGYDLQLDPTTTIRLTTSKGFSPRQTDWDVTFNWAKRF